MQLQARFLLCAAVACLAVAEIAARPSSPTSPEIPLRRDARETNGFHTAHQDAGITKYNSGVDSLRSASYQKENFEEKYPQYDNINNETEATTVSSLPSTDNPLVDQASISRQKEDLSYDYASSESVMIPTETLENISESTFEYQYKDSTTTSSDTEHTTDFSEHDRTVNKWNDHNLNSFVPLNDPYSSLSSQKNKYDQASTEIEPDNLNNHAVEKEYSEIPHIETVENRSTVETNYFSDNNDTASFFPEQGTEQTSDVVSNSSPNSSQKNDQEIMTSPQTYMNYQSQNHEDNQNYYKGKEQSVLLRNLVEQSNYKEHSKNSTDKKEALPSSTPDEYYNYQSSYNAPEYDSMPYSESNTNNYFQSSPATQYKENAYIYREGRRQGSNIQDETHNIRNFRNSRSFYYYLPSDYKQTPGSYPSPAQGSYASSSQNPSFNVNPNSQAPLIQAPYSVTYRIFNTNVFESSGAGGSQTPGDPSNRQLSWPFADYFPIVINDPFLAAYTAFFNMIEYGPEADICRRLNAQKERLLRVAQAPQKSVSYQMAQAETNTVPPVYVTAPTAQSSVQMAQADTNIFPSVYIPAPTLQQPSVQMAQAYTNIHSPVNNPTPTVHQPNVRVAQTDTNTLPQVYIPAPTVQQPKVRTAQADTNTLPQVYIPAPTVQEPKVRTAQADTNTLPHVYISAPTVQQPNVRMVQADKNSLSQVDDHSATVQSSVRYQMSTTSDTTRKPAYLSTDTREEHTDSEDKPTEIIMSTNDTSRNATFVTKLVVRKGGVSIAGPGGIATAGSGGLAIVGPGGVAYTSPNGMAIVGPGGKVIGLPSGGEVLFDHETNADGEGAQRYLANIPPGGKVVAEGPTIYYHPPQSPSSLIH